MLALDDEGSGANPALYLEHRAKCQNSTIRQHVVCHCRVVYAGQKLLPHLAQSGTEEDRAGGQRQPFDQELTCL